MDGQMWIATDKDGRQRLFQGPKPWRDYFDEWDREPRYWINWNPSVELIFKPFPNQTFEDEPIEVMLVRKW